MSLVRAAGMATTQPMIYLPTRVTAEQHARLVAARDRDGVSISEHVRAALNPYLDKLDRRNRSAPEPEVKAKIVNGAGAAAADGPANLLVGSRPAAAAPRIARQPTVRTR